MYKLLFILVSVLFLLACGGAQALTPTPPPTLTSTPISEPTLEITSHTEAKKGIVRIVARGTFVEPGGIEVNAMRSGTGFIIDPSGIVVTNNHIVTGAALLEVWLDGEDKPREARLIAAAECSDLAVIDIAGEKFPFFKWHTESVMSGTEVFVGGFPRGETVYQLKGGSISRQLENIETVWASVNRAYEYSIQTVGGISGAPVVTLDGKVVAVHYATSALVDDEGLGISSELAQPLITELQKGEDIDSIGINGRAEVFNNQLFGIWVSSVKSGSPADQAGIQAGDLIRQLEGLVLATDGFITDYCAIIRNRKPTTDTMSLVVWRLATNEILEGQINGRELTVVGKIPDLGIDEETVTSTPISDPTPTSCPHSDSACILSTLGFSQNGQMVRVNQGSIPIVFTDGNSDSVWGWFDLELENDLPNNYVLHTTIEWGDDDDHCQVSFNRNPEGNRYYQIGISPDQVIYSQKRNYDNWPEFWNFQTDSLSPNTNNEFVIVARGDLYKVYINGLQEPLDTFTDSAYSGGGVALIAWSPSGGNIGDPSCTFKDLWVWAPNN